MSGEFNETSKVFQIRQSTLDEMRRATQIGRLIHVWGTIILTIIGALIYGGVKFGSLATVNQVELIDGKLIHIETRLDDIEKLLRK